MLPRLSFSSMPDLNAVILMNLYLVTFKLEVNFTCLPHPSRNNSLNTKVFYEFPGLEYINLNFITARKIGDNFFNVNMHNINFKLKTHMGSQLGSHFLSSAQVAANLLLGSTTANKRGFGERR